MGDEDDEQSRDESGAEDGPPGDEAAGAPAVSDEDLGTPPSIAALTAPRATLYRDPSVVQPLPAAEPWTVAQPQVGSLDDLADVLDDEQKASAPGTGPTAPTATASDAPSPDPRLGAPLGAGAPDPGGRASAKVLLVGAAVLVVVLLVGLVVVLSGGDDPAGDGEVAADVDDDRGAGPDADAEEATAPEGPGSPSTTIEPTTTEPPPEADEEPTTPPTQAEAPPPTAAPAAPPPVPPTEPPPAVVVPVAPGERAPAQLVVSAQPMDGGRLVVGRPGTSATLQIDNIGGSVGSYTASGPGLRVSIPNNSIGAGGSTTLHVSATPGPDRFTSLLVQGSGGLSMRFDVVIE